MSGTSRPAAVRALIAAGSLAASFAPPAAADDPAPPATVVAPAGARVPAGSVHDGRWALFVFVATDCPISNRYAPELGALRRAFAAGPAAFALVYAGPHVRPAEIEAHGRDYALDWPAWRDPEFALADRLGARVTPEAVVVAPDGAVVYRGRIDDLYEDFGRYRPAPRTRDLRDVLDALARGERPEPRVVPAVGCPLRGTGP